MKTSPNGSRPVVGYIVETRWNIVENFIVLCYGINGTVVSFYIGVFLALVKKKIGRFEFNELNRESNRERKRQKAQLKAAEPEAS